jgi:hypothetical protein
VPVLQLSICVQALPSLQIVPSLASGLEQTPEAGLHAPATWHWSSAVQAVEVPVHVPATHASFFVHAFPSLQVVPSAAVGLEHFPLVVSHVPTVWHASAAVHVTGLAPVHVPLWQVSVWVHALPSLHEVPFAAAGFVHVPVLVLQVPAP